MILHKAPGVHAWDAQKENQQFRMVEWLLDPSNEVPLSSKDSTPHMQLAIKDSQS